MIKKVFSWALIIAFTLWGVQPLEAADLLRDDYDLIPESNSSGPSPKTGYEEWTDPFTGKSLKPADDDPSGGYLGRSVHQDGESAVEDTH